MIPYALTPEHEARRQGIQRASMGEPTNPRGERLGRQAEGYTRTIRGGRLLVGSGWMKAPRMGGA